MQRSYIPEGRGKLTPDRTTLVPAVVSLPGGLPALIANAGERTSWRFIEFFTATIKAFLANGAAQRIHLERLPAYAPELNPDEGLWQQLKGVELRNVCCYTIPHLRSELRDAVKRVRRKPRLIQGFFRGAKL